MNCSRKRQWWCTWVGAVALVSAFAVRDRGRSAARAAGTGDVSDISIVRTLDRHPGARIVGALHCGVDRHCNCSLPLARAFLARPTWATSSAARVKTRARHGASRSLFSTTSAARVRSNSPTRNPVHYRPPGQDVVWCFAMRCPINWHDSEDARLAAAYSADGGRTWTPVELSMVYTGPLIVVGGIFRGEREGQTHYLLPAHRNTLRHDPLGSRDQFVLESTSLLEWKLAGTATAAVARTRPGQEKPAGFIPQPATGKVFLHEGQLAGGDRMASSGW